MALGLSHCTPSSSTSTSQSTKPPVSLAKVSSTGTGTAAASAPARPGVSAFELDDSDFLVRAISVGLQTYIGSQTPVLNYKLPSSADYAEILRCPSNTVILGVSSAVPLQDVELSGLSTAQKNQIYQTNDFFNAAINAGCAQISLGTVVSSFYDSWAPTGSYRYVIRACVSPQRLLDTATLTTRNCSMQVGISAALTDYVNSRSDQQNTYLEKTNADSANLLLALQAAKQQADTYACFLQWCECGATAQDQSICQRDAQGNPTSCSGGAYMQAVTLKKKQAIITLTAVSLDLTMTLATSSFEGPIGIAGDLLGATTALSGMSFNTMFQSLASQVQDFPKACAAGISLNLQMSAVAESVLSIQNQYAYDNCQAQAAGAMLNATAGSDTSSTLSNSASCPTLSEIMTDTTVSTSTGSSL